MVTTSTSNLHTVSSDEAILSSSDGFTAFSFGGYRIRFRAPYSFDSETFLKPIKKVSIAYA